MKGLDSASQKYFNACSTGNVPLVADYLAKGVSPEARDGYGLTGLIWAGRKGRIGVADLLLQAGAAIDAADRRGRTALYHAVTFRRYDLVRYLADLGANVSPIDCAGWTPREVARTLGDTRMVSLLDALGATPSPQDSEWAALSSSQNELMLYIGEMCGGPDVRDSAIAKALERVLLARGENYGDIGTSLDFVFEISGSGER